MPANATAWLDADLTAEAFGEYIYEVRAYNAAGNSDTSYEASATMPLLILATGQDGGVQITSNGPATLNSQPLTYSIKRTTFDETHGTAIAGSEQTFNGTGPVYLDGTTTAGKSYFYTLTATDAGGGQVGQATQLVTALPGDKFARINFTNNNDDTRGRLRT